MKKFYQKQIAFIFMMVITISGFAQKSFFSDVSETIAKQSGGTRSIVPLKYRTISLDEIAMKNFLWSLPSEKNVVNRKTAPILELPMPDGRIAKFNVWESSIQEPALEAKYPNIKTFLGQGIDDPYATIRFDYTPRGFHAQVLTINGTYYIDPFAVNKLNNYISYFRTDLSRETSAVCLVQENTETQSRPSGITADCRGTSLRTYRLAVACTGEYAQAPGISAGTNPAILHAAIVTSVNRVVGVYEKEVALRMILVATNNIVEYLDAATDPFTGNNNDNILINESQTVIDANIGVANYDIGHTFSTGAGGRAQLQSPCGPSKARGVTGLPNPVGDAFDIDFVAHEIGHQWGGSHPFNGQVGNCSGANRSGPQAYEPGSGTTIQAYAGICGSDNLQPNSDPFFHGISFDQISNFVTFGNGATCGVASATGNGIPVINPLTNSGLTIPIGTPFTLTGSATDPDGDALTYCWEQWDLGPQSAWNAGATAAANNTLPLFKSRAPKVSGSRTFPDIAVINANYPANPAATMGGLKGETLSPVARSMSFKLTVRDNKAAGGGLASIGSGGCQTNTPFVINVSGTAPFVITSPNGGESYPASSTQTVTWNLAGTNAAPFNVSDVKISFSSDGGLTYPTVLLATTANDGTEIVTMPSTATTTAKIKVEAIGNIFFDVSNANFILTAPVTDFNFGTVTTTTSACPAAATLAVTIPTTQTGGFANPITLSAASGVPAGTTITFAANPVTAGTSSVATLNNANTLPAGTYVVTVSGAATGATNKTVNITYTITAGSGPVLTTQSTAQTVCAPATATFNVATAAAPVTHQWQVATAAAPTTFNNIATATTASFTTPATMASMNGNIYRCIVATQCGTTTSNTAVLTVNTAAAITAQPANFPACTGLTATFNTTATGTGVTYQWQSATAVGGPYTNIAGATSASYTTPAITAATPTFYQVVATTTLCPAAVTSSVAQLTISTTTAIGTQPTAQTVCVPNTAVFGATATGTGVAGGALTYQWQVATAAAPTTFTNIAGATTTFYNTGATMATMNGNIYHLVVTGACNTATSSNVTLTANTAAALGTILPTAQTVCNGVAATFTGSATGTGVITYQWQSGPSSTGPWNTVIGGSGATTASYTTAATTPSMNGTWYRMLAITTTCAGSVNTTPVLLTVNTVAIINTNNAPTQSACIPQTATFTVAASGTGLTYQWQVATAAAPTVFTDIASATSDSYTTPATTLAMNGNRYRVNILSTCSPTTPTTSNASILTVNNPVTISAQPTAQSGCSNDNYTFSVTAVSPGNTITYAWEVSTTGAAGPFTPVANSAIYSGVATNALVITNAPLFINGNYYRVFISVPCGSGVSSSYSSAVPFNISSKPTVVLTKPAVSNTNAAVNTILSTTVSPFTVGQNATYTWKKNGTIIPNTLASTSIVVPVDDAGSYEVSITDASTGCVAKSNIIVTDALTSDNLLTGKVFIYPNPVSDRMIVRYNNSAAPNRATSIAVYDEKGARVITKPFSIVGTNGRMEIDMSRLALGTYIVYIVDASGKKLATGKAVKVQ